MDMDDLLCEYGGLMIQNTHRCSVELTGNGGADGDGAHHDEEERNMVELR
jgi:hypothetical protein